VKIFGREPTLVIQTLGAILSVFVALGLPGLSVDQAAVIIAFLTAAVAAVNALAVRPIAPAAFIGLVAAGAVLLAAYGYHVPQSVLGAIQAAVVAILAFATRAQVTPVAAPGVDQRIPARGPGRMAS
jgi:hypothetical protein